MFCTIRKMKIIDMIQNSQKGTQFLNLHQQFGKFSWCVAVLSVVILIMLSPIVSIKNINIYSMDENRWDDHNCFGKLHTCLLVLHGQKKEENRESSIALPYNFLYVEWNIFTFAEFFF